MPSCIKTYNSLKHSPQYIFNWHYYNLFSIVSINDLKFDNSNDRKLGKDLTFYSELIENISCTAVVMAMCYIIGLDVIQRTITQYRSFAIF